MYFFIKTRLGKSKETCYATTKILSMYNAWLSIKNCDFKAIYYERCDDSIYFSLMVYEINNIEIENMLREESGKIRLVFVSPFDSRRHTTWLQIGCIDRITEIVDSNIIIDKFIPVNISTIYETPSSFSHKYRAITKDESGKNILVTGKTKSDALFNLSLKKNIIDMENNISMTQIRRSYILHPYKKIIDYVFGTSTENADEVFDGDIEIIRRGEKWP